MARKEDRPIPFPKYVWGINGLIHRKEANFLYTTPVRLGDGLYGDIGTFCGRSVACMAGGMLDNDVKGHVITVDPYLKTGAYAEEKLLRRYRNMLKSAEEVRQTLEGKGLGSYVTVVEGMSVKVATDYKDKEFVFIFIDADHSYKECKADFEAWSPLVRSGGEIAFHDTNLLEVNRVVEESGWEVINQIYTIKVIQKP